MLQCAPLVTPFLAVIVSDAMAPREEVFVAPDAEAAVIAEYALDPQMPPPRPPRARQRFTLKGGYYDASEDGLDDGSIFNAAWLLPRTDVFSTELEIGYLEADGTHHGVDRDLWSIPLMLNGRFTVPVGEKLELYGGLGIGSFYYDADVDAGAVSVSADGFLFGGDGFFGGSVHLGKSIWLGLEGKYYITEEASDLGGGLDAFVAMLTLGFER